ncbi:hypothetical protein FCV25MIE_21705 [Fagus crenata]
MLRSTVRLSHSGVLHQVFDHHHRRFSKGLEPSRIFDWRHEVVALHLRFQGWDQSFSPSHRQQRPDSLLGFGPHRHHPHGPAQGPDRRGLGTRVSRQGQR